MSSSDDLFRLIKSLNKQEKRYFKLRTAVYNKPAGHQAHKLFDALDKLHVYDERAFLRNHPNAPFVKHFAPAKYELTTMLLNSLAAFHAKASVEAELREQLSYIEILYRKGLYGHCGKIVAKTLKKAEAYEKRVYVIEILSWERKLHLRNAGDILEDRLSAYFERIKQTLETHLNATLYLDVLDTVQTARRRYGRLSSSEERTELLSKIERLVTDIDTPADSFTAQTSRLQAHGTLAAMKGEVAGALECYSSALEVWESNQLHIRDNPDNYKRYLMNFLICCISLRRFDQFENAISKIKALRKTPEDDDPEMISIVYHAELYYCLNAGLLSEGFAVAQKIDKGLGNFGEIIRPHRFVVLCYNCSVVYFLNGHFTGALGFINRILNRTDAEPRRDIQTFTRVFQLIIHFELNNIDILENLIRSTYRYLKKHGKVSEFETITLHGIKRLAGCADADERLRAYKDIRENLERFMRQNTSNLHIGLIEAFFWAESKIRDGSIAAAYAEKVNPDSPLDVKRLFPDPQ